MANLNIGTMTIYNECTPNTENNLHYYFTSISSYLTKLNQISSSSRIIQPDNYRIVNNYVEIPLDNYLNYTPTYISVEYVNSDDSTLKFYEFYFVDSIEIISGYIRLNLTKDLWATYISKCSIDKVILLKTNRDVAEIGNYDNIQMTNGLPEYEQLTRSFYDTPLADNVINYCCVFTCVYYLTNSSITEQQTSAQVGTYAMELDTAFVTDINKLVDYVRGIVRINIDNNNYKCEVINAWLIDKEFLTLSTTESNVFGSIIKINPDTPPLQITCKKCNTNEYTKDLGINQSYIFNNLNKKIYVGTKYNGFEIKRIGNKPDTSTLKSIGCYIKVITKEDGIQIFIGQGNDTIELTNDFSIGITTNQGTFTSQERTARAISNVASIISGGLQVGAGIGSLIGGNPLGITSVVSGASSISGTIAKSQLPSTNGSYNKGGDGRIIYETPNPFYIVKYSSLDEEYEKFYQYGLNYYAGYYNFSTFVSISSRNSYVALNLYHDFVQMECEVNLIPSNARNLIKQKFLQGIKIDIL